MENTAKNFVLQLGALAALYVSLGSLIALCFGIINLIFPDAAEGYWAVESAQSSIRFAIASLFVFFPTYIVLTRMVNVIRRTEHGVYLTLTRWLIFLSLFVGGAILLGDLVAVIWSFLNGELTTRFLLKAGVLLVIVSAAFKYYLLDVRGYWNTNERYSIMFGAVAGLLVIAAMVVGYLNISSPAETREYRLDEQQVSDLQTVQYRIEEHFRVENSLPASLDDVFLPSLVPSAPEGRDAYSYSVLNGTTYELCATFAHSTERGEETKYLSPIADPSYEPMNYNWDHEAGRHCFERVVSAE